MATIGFVDNAAEIAALRRKIQTLKSEKSGYKSQKNALEKALEKSAKIPKQMEDVYDTERNVKAAKDKFKEDMNGAVDASIHKSGIIAVQPVFSFFETIEQIASKADREWSREVAKLETKIASVDSRIRIIEAQIRELQKIDF